MPIELPLNELSTVLARIEGVLLTEESVNRAVNMLAEAARDAIPGAAGAGASLINAQGRRTSTGATDELVRAADELQYDLGEGPCLTSWASTRVVRSDDLTSEERWPHWSARATQLGILSVISTPLVFRGESLGAMKAYSLEPNAFDQHSEHLLALMTGPAVTLLANVQTSEAPHRISRELKSAIQSRDSIAFARGILMERGGLDPDAAMLELLRRARAESRSLLSVSEQVIKSVTGPRD